MKVIVNHEICESQGVCVRNCSKMFKLDADDKLAILMDIVPEKHHKAVGRAVIRCPKQALSIEEG